MKVIVWGFPLYSHTHSYVHYGWVKGFKALGHETYWFHDESYPKEFDYSDCLFISEGYADKNIPIVASSTYFIHVCVNPEKYLNKGARLIDLRYNVSEIFDVNYHYILNKSECIPISKYTYYQNLHDNSGLTKHDNNPTPMKYEAIYMMWATDLLPDEINLEDAKKSRESSVHYIGSPIHEQKILANEFSKRKIPFISHNPWQHGMAFANNKELIQKSLIAPDIRSKGDHPVHTGTNHLKIGYIPCRVFKNISYGQLGITNSKAVYDLFEGNIIYSDDIGEMIDMALARKDDVEFIQTQMKFVRDNHTYLNRISDIIAVYNKKF